MANRLESATSPYLLQHKDNPVDWWEWSDEAFAEARRRDVPVLLSVGYAACHWCHVMAHESFEDAGSGAAPKFPPSANLEQLLRHAARRRLEATGADGSVDVAAVEAGSGGVALDLAERTLRAMAHSGMYDQLAGGFARYAVDAA